MTGKEIRLNRLFKKSQRLLAVPLDHGVTVGPIDGLRDIRRVVKAVADGGADAVIVHKGLVKQIAPSLDAGCELIVHLSASTALAPDPDRKELVTSVEHAIRLGASGVSVHVNLGAGAEAVMLKDLGRVAEECELWGMPLLVMVYVRDGCKQSEYDPAKIKHAARVVEEVGADIIKVNYTGSADTFEEIVQSVRVPVVIAGGPKLNSNEDLIDVITQALKAGARGVAIGRNVFQSPDPARLTSLIRQVLDGQSAPPLEKLLD